MYLVVDGCAKLRETVIGRWLCHPTHSISINQYKWIPVWGWRSPLWENNADHAPYRLLVAKYARLVARVYVVYDFLIICIIRI